MNSNNKVYLDIITRMTSSSEQIRTEAQRIQDTFSKIKLPKDIDANFSKSLSKLISTLDTFDKEKNKAFQSGDMTGMIKSGQKIVDLFEDLKVTATRVGRISGKTLESLFPEEVAKNIKSANDALRQYQNSITANTKKVERQNVKITEQEKVIQKINEEMTELANKKISDQQWNKLKKDAEDYSKQIEQVRKQLSEEKGKLNKNASSDQYNAQLKTILNLGKRLATLRQQYQAVDTQLKSSVGATEYSNKLSVLQKKLDAAKEKQRELSKELAGLTKSLPQQSLDRLFKTLEQIPGIDLSKFSRDATGAAEAVAHLMTETSSNTQAGLNGLVQIINDSSQSFSNLNTNTLRATEIQRRFNEELREVDMLKHRIQYFFGLNNAINLFRRAISSAFNTVKELDAAMTEIAVVSEFEVGDMWKTLPQFTEQANKLGVAVKEAYAGTTLFVQQGLELDRAMAISNETLKMARIAGMDAAAATDAMTSAIRGYGMAVNEISAKRVNDVYSEIAAISASNAQELATAQSKTASLAHSVGAEFETTTAILATAIEATRETAETIGTAYKTVGARFSELKKSPNQIVDVEGEEVDANRVEAALRSAGVALRDVNGQFRDFDDVLLELSSKWDTLDVNTKRFIATQAAGSRQQSRFIAMVSNYERTMELVNAAYSSEGASDRQFGKTLDSLQTKIQRLKNAADEFTTGIANSTVIKGFIDLLTELISLVNRLTSDLGEAGGAIAKIGVAVGGIKLGKKLFNNLFKGSAAMSAEAGDMAGLAFNNSFKGKLESFKVSRASSKGFFKSLGLMFKTTTFGPNTHLIGNYISEIMGTNPNALNGSNLKTHIDEYVRANSQAIDDAWRQANPDKKQSYSFSKSFLLRSNTSLESQVNGLKKLGIEVRATEKDLHDAGVRIETDYAAVAQTVATGMMVVGAGFSAIGRSLKESGSEKIGGVFTSLGNYAMSFGMIMSVTLPLMVKTGSALITKTLMGIPIVGWVAIAGAAITSLVSIFNALKPETAEEKLERLANQTKDSKRAADEAKQAYQELLDTFDGYSKAQDALEELTRGTDEFKEALYEANNNVLDIIKNYPELAKYLETGRFGQLSLSEQGWNTFKTQQKAVRDNYNYRAMGDEYFERQFRNETDKAKAIGGKISVDLMPQTIKTIQGIVDDGVNLNKYVSATTVSFDNMRSMIGDQVEALYDIYDSNVALKFAYTSFEGFVNALENRTIDSSNLAEGQFFQYSQDLLDLVKRANTEGASNNYGTSPMVTPQQIIDAIQEAARFLPTGSANEEILEGYINAAISSSAPKELFDSDYGSQIQHILSEAISSEEVSQAITTSQSKWSEKTREEIEARYKELFDLDEIPTDIDNDAMVQAIASVEVFKDEIGETVEKFFNYLQGQAVDVQEQIIDFTHNKGVGLNLDQIGALLSENGLLKSEFSGQRGNYDYEALTNVLGFDVRQVATALDMSVKEYVQLIIDNARAAKDAYDAAVGILGSKTIAPNKYKAHDRQVIVQLATQVEKMGEKDAQTYVDQFNKIVGSSNLDTFERKGLSNYLSTVDWTDLNEAIKALEYMETLNINTSTVENYWKAAINGAKGYVSTMQEAIALVEKFQGRMAGAQEIGKRLEGGEATTEDMQQLINAGVDVSNYTLTPDGWAATDEEIKNATRSLLEYNAALSQTAVEAQKSRIAVLEAQSRNKENALNVTTGEAGIRQDENGKYYINERKLNASVKNSDAVNRMASSLGISQGEMTNEQFAQAVKEAVFARADELNTMYQTVNLLTKTADMTEGLKGDTASTFYANGTESQVRYALQEEAKQYGLNAKSIIEYSDALRKSVGNEKMSQQQADYTAMAMAKAQKGMETVAGSYEDWNRILEKGVEVGPEYNRVLDEMQSAMQLVFNTTEKIPQNFLVDKKNIDLMTQFLNGNKSAFQELQKNYSTSILVEIEAEANKPQVTSQIDLIKSIIASAEFQDIKVGANLDTSQFINALNQLLAMVPGIASQIQAMLGNFNISANVTMANRVVTSQQANAIMAAGGQVEKKVVNAAGKTIYVTKSPTITNAVQQPVAPVYAGPPVGGGGGGGGSSQKEVENSYDRQYNLLQDITAEQRNREQLERRYKRILAQEGTSGRDLVELTRQEYESLKKQFQLQQTMLEMRRRELDALIAKSKALAAYMAYNTVDQTIEINWEALNNLAKTDPEKYAEVSRTISQMETIQNQIREAERALEDIQDSVEELKNRGRDAYIDLEERVLSALIQEQQEIIDNQEEIKDSINTASKDLIDAIKDSIDKYRQDRENEKTESRIAEKERRLAYLRQDTTGANAVEIKRLEEELAQEKEGYGDSLVDQALKNLQDQTDAAAEQRERQIQLLQDQLAWAEETGAYVGQVKAIIEDGILNGEMRESSRLVQLLKKAENVNALAEVSYAQWMEELRDTIAQAYLFAHGQINGDLSGGGVASSLSGFDPNKDYMAAMQAHFAANGGQMDEEIKQLNRYRNQKMDMFPELKEKYPVYEDTEEGLRALHNYLSTVKSTANSGGSIPSSYTSRPSSSSSGSSSVATPSVSTGGYTPSVGDYVRVTPGAKFANGSTINSGVQQSGVISGKPGAFKVLQDAGNGNYYIGASMSAGGVTGLINKKYLMAFKKGGLVDFTGPAWLDGSKSNPEMVLSAADTRNFMNLRDILSSFGGFSQNSLISGDSYFDIDVNIDQINDDYSVDLMIDAIKRRLYSDSMYRNNNQVTSWR